jgi:hypothetical protein
MIPEKSDTKDFVGASGELNFDKESWSFDIPLHMRMIKDRQFVVLSAVQK